MAGEGGQRDLGERTEEYALRVVRMYCALPKRTEAQVLGKQALRSGTSVGAQYREAKRARSPAEFASKLESALQELDETEYWLKLLVRSGIVEQALMSGLLGETEELLRIFTAGTKKAKGRGRTGDRKRKKKDGETPRARDGADSE